MMDKGGATVTLPDGIEGFVPAKGLAKQDGSMPAVGETLPFKIVDFNKANKRIVLSHVKTYETAPEPKEAEQKPAKEENSMKSTVNKINSNIEKTTLGDISELAALKSKLESGE